MTSMNAFLFSQQVAFEEVFAEPHPSIFSFDKIWGLSYTVFTGSKLWCYRITTAILGLPAACCWGCTFACISFTHIWCCVPGMKAIFINLRCIKVCKNLSSICPIKLRYCLSRSHEITSGLIIIILTPFEYCRAVHTFVVQTDEKCHVSECNAYCRTCIHA